MAPEAELDGAAFSAAAPPEATPLAHGYWLRHHRRSNQASNDAERRSFHAYRNDGDAGIAPADLSVGGATALRPATPTSAITGAASPCACRLTRQG